MSGINLGRVLLGGLAAGFILNCIDAFVGIVLLADEMTAMVTRLNLDPVAAQNIWPLVCVDFAYGILIVFTYAAMRPRFGAGPKTGVIAGLTLWLAIGTIVYGFHAMGIFSAHAFLINAIFTGIGAMIAGVVGGWLYKE